VEVGAVGMEVGMLAEAEVGVATAPAALPHTAEGALLEVGEVGGKSTTLSPDRH